MSELTRPDEPTRWVEIYRRFLAEEVFEAVTLTQRWEAEAAEDRANGHRPHYCIHGTNMWVDYDCACHGCEEGLTAWDMAERTAWDRHARYLRVVDMFYDLTRAHEKTPVPTYVTEAYLQWLTEVSPANAENKEDS